MSTKNERCVVFKLGGEEILRYTVRGTFAGELQNTKELLAAQHGCEPEDIKVHLTSEPKERR